EPLEKTLTGGGHHRLQTLPVSPSAANGFIGELQFRCNLKAVLVGTLPTFALLVMDARLVLQVGTEAGTRGTDCSYARSLPVMHCSPGPAGQGTRGQSAGGRGALVLRQVAAEQVHRGTEQK